MSKLKVDTLEGKASATSITLPTTTNIGSTPLVSASANSMTIKGEGSATTNIQQGLTKVWAVGDQDSAQDLKDSFNVSSMNDASEGIIDFNIANNMANANYSASGNGRRDSGGNAIYCRLSDITTSLIKTYWLTPDSLSDTEHACLQINGDLA
tara:strand:+ start:1021 stop:1479 length:459 start_codon:yes stop_codon:yes gene_type:complete